MINKKYSKYVITLILITLLFVNSSCQVLKGLIGDVATDVGTDVATLGVREVGEGAMRGAARELASEVGEEVAEEMIEEAAQELIETQIRTQAPRIAREIVQESIEEQAQQSIRSELRNMPIEQLIEIVESDRIRIGESLYALNDLNLPWRDARTSYNGLVGSISNYDRNYSVDAPIMELAEKFQALSASSIDAIQLEKTRSLIAQDGIWFQSIDGAIQPIDTPIFVSTGDGSKIVYFDHQWYLTSGDQLKPLAELATSLGTDLRLAMPSKNQTGVFASVVEEVPLEEALYPITYEIDGQVIAGQIDPLTGVQYLTLETVPPNFSDTLKTLQQTYKEFDRSVNAVDLESIAKLLIDAPPLGKALLEFDLNVRLTRIDELLDVAGPEPLDEALSLIEQSKRVHRDHPELTLREGVILIKQETEPEELAVTLNNMDIRQIDDVNLFFNETLPRIFAGSDRNEELEHVAKLHDVHHYLKVNKLDGVIQTGVHEDRMVLMVGLGEDQLQPSELTAQSPIPSDFPAEFYFYKEDSPGIFNLEIGVSGQGTLGELVGGNFDVGQIGLLARQDISHFRPSVIYTVTDEAGDEGIDLPLNINFLPPATATAIELAEQYIPLSGQDEDSQDNGEMVYVFFQAAE